MTNFNRWCRDPEVLAVGKHELTVLASRDDAVGIVELAGHIPSRYADTETLARIATRAGKTQLSRLLRKKIPKTQRARSGDLGEILATAYIAEEYGFRVGPSRLIHRDHQEWAMRGDDVLGAKFKDKRQQVVFIKGEAKSRKRASKAVVTEARAGLQRNGGLPSPHSLVQFGERLLNTEDDALGAAVLDLELSEGVRPKMVTHLMFLFAGNDPRIHVKADLTARSGPIAQRAVILTAAAHQDFIRDAFEKAIADGA